MNAKIRVPYGDDLPGLIGYLFGPGKANEHTDPHLVASSEHVELAGAPRFQQPGELQAAKIELDRTRRTLGSDIAGGYVWHCSLSLPPDDRQLTDAEWGEIAREVIRRLGFDTSTGKAPCRWIAVRHGLSTGGNDHIHLAVNLVREDGTKANTFKDFVKVSKACAEFERRYALQVVDGRPGAGMPGLKRGEMERARREGRDEPDRLRLARSVRACATAAQDEAEFVRRLRRAGVLARPRYAPGGRQAVIGYSVALRPDDGASPIWYGGGKLAADLTLTRLREGWHSTPDGLRNAASAWRTPNSRPQTAPERTVYGGHTWEQAAQVVTHVRAQLAQVPVDDLDAWASAARQTAGVLAAWSSRLETRGAGPLAKAANALARSAQTSPATPRRSPHRSAVRDLRGVAIVALQATPRGRGDSGQVMLLRQLTRLMEAIHDAHLARGQARQAQLLAAVAREDLAGLHRTIGLPIEAGVPAQARREAFELDLH
ncbi:relaxase/mobilization nuclease domain-containing protein [Streptosporangium lutulentum]|uniref:MobA/VirD2-like nuclease domain-containing protein n=1 Tax=Streptosporangium lutulentum TaxID=1461250 RepID=A0ABT9QWP4_9ACTN|nr:hypothetical protein [Streptosporangium lutulentum]MDP9850374.1 hypothetical protein [Streptosporangium lutulentum]